uniref:ARAD1D35750p n=1 Tax=Blastobotrys adeninivorans TaxID=409370 RepID=A0A060TH37_BLAAD
MDSHLLHNMMDSIYMPENNNCQSKAIPQHHPSLIMMDKQTDTTHHQSCGCNGGFCIKDAWWYQEEQSKKSSVPPRPRFVSTASTSSVSSTSSY